MQSSSDIQSLGDGSDNAGNAATQGLKAAKQAGKMAGNAAAKGAEEATKAAAGAAVKAGVQTGKAVANVAAGTAAGGPWGAIISAAWSMRHTLFKVLVSICLVIVFIVVIIVSLPSIIFQNIFGLDDGASFNDSYNDLSYSITDVIQEAYQDSLLSVDNIISEGGYDYGRSKDALRDNANPTQGFDPAYIIAAYSVSMLQENTTKDDMLSKLNSVSGLMFPVTYVVRQVENFFEDPLGYIFSEITTFVECVIHPFDNSVILKAFGIDLDVKYGSFDITYGEAIDNMAEGLRLSLGG